MRALLALVEVVRHSQLRTFGDFGIPESPKMKFARLWNLVQSKTTYGSNNSMLLGCGPKFLRLVPNAMEVPFKRLVPLPVREV